MEKVKTVKLATKHIRIDGGTQPRAELNESVVAEYSEAMQSGAEFPPCVVFYDGSNNWLGDGFHRYFGAEKAAKTLLCEQRPGSRRDAILYSVGANATHGLRRTNADKRRAVETLLQDDEWGGRSDRWIAEQCGVSPSFVGGVRVELGVHDGHLSATRIGQDGKIYPALGGPKPLNPDEMAAAQGISDDDDFPDPFDDTTPEASDNIENYGDGVPVNEPTPAEQYAAAPVVSDTIGDAPAINEDDLTDDEWLMTLPLFKLFVSRGNKALLLRADALGWRTMQQAKAFGSFRHHAQKAFDFNASRTPLAYRIHRACFVRHPKEWGGCVTCRGKGCTECSYTGASIDGGLTIEQMEARA